MATPALLPASIFLSLACPLLVILRLASFDKEHRGVVMGEGGGRKEERGLRRNLDCSDLATIITAFTARQSEKVAGYPQSRDRGKIK